MEAVFLVDEPVALIFRLLPWLRFLHSAIALGRAIHFVPLVAGNDRKHQIGRLQ
jgi:hypothetical protein